MAKRRTPAVDTPAGVRPGSVLRADTWIIIPVKTALYRIFGTERTAALRGALEHYRRCLAELRGSDPVSKERLLDTRLAGARSRLAPLMNLHRGERCFIIGNGPSLKQTDVPLLRKEITFGMNRIYLAFPEMGLETTYYVAVNQLVLEQCAADISQLAMPKFISCRAPRDLTFPEDTIFLNTSGRKPWFSFDPAEVVWEMGTVTNVALQLAYYMGFQQVILIGVDHSFSTKGPPNTEVLSEGDDVDHFSKEYFGKGFRWHLPDLETSELGYRMAKAVFEAGGREIVDATVGGKLQVFRKVAYESLFS